MPQFEASASDGPLTGSSISVSLAGVGTNRLGLVKVYWFDAAPAITSVDWGSTDITSNLIKHATHDVPGRKHMAWYYIVDPPTSSETVQVTLDASSGALTLIAEVYSGVHQSSPLGTIAATADGTEQTSLTPSLDVGGEADDLITDVYNQWTSDQGSSATATADSPQTETEKTTADVNGQIHGGSYRDSAGATTTMSWTINASSSVAWAMYGIAIKPGAAASVGLFPLAFNQRNQFRHMIVR